MFVVVVRSSVCGVSVAAEADLRELRNVVVMPGDADGGPRAGGYHHYVCTNCVLISLLHF